MEKHELDDRITEVSKSILSYCTARTSNHQDAEDLAQDMICEIMKSSQNIRDDKAFYGFMWSVAGNVYKQWYRKKLRRSECGLTEEINAENEDFENVLDDKSDIYLLRRELSLLSEKYRRAAILYYLEDKPCAEIAPLLSVSESMVKYLLFKTRKILKEGMNTERNYGEQSYNPKNLTILYMGEGPNHYSNLVDGNRIRQNILWACYNDKLAEEEIALQIGVSLPYIESDLTKLTETGLLTRDGNYYKTNIIILTEDFQREVSLKLVPLQKEAAENIKQFIEENAKTARDIGFYGNDMSQNSLKWQLTCMIMQHAFSRTGDIMFAPGKAPVTAFGERAYIWGTELFNNGFNCCGIDAEEWHTDINMYFMDWIESSQTNHNDFYGNINFVKMYSKLARGIAPVENEYEQNIAAELLRRGYVYKKEGKLLVTMPVFSKEENEKLIAILKPVIDGTAALFERMTALITAILRNHTPSHLKSKVEAAAAMNLFQEGAYVPVSMLNKSGYLSTIWDANENATSYVVLK